LRATGVQEYPMSDGSIRLIVFSDDWGRHPSSCQHLVRHLLPRYRALWVNTVGTRRPTLSIADLKRVAGKVFKSKPAPAAMPANLEVVSPRMWPGFRSGWQRRFNAKQMAKAIHAKLGPRLAGERRVVITTLPITADLVGALDADAWLYYCVDDFSVWPGLDGNVMNDMEREQLAKVDGIVAVSETLRARLSGMGRGSALLTHGIDLDHWRAPASGPSQTELARAKESPAGLPDWWSSLPRPIFLFWGLVDARLDEAWCRALSDSLLKASGGSGGGGTLVLIGPQQSPPASLAGLANVRMPGPLPYEGLPAVAGAADVLVMPYADAAVTRAMQPLKFKEYLAAGFEANEKPVVVRKLPSTEAWRDAADVVDSAEAFVRIARERATNGLPGSQREARRRLVEESWEKKAAELEIVIQKIAANERR